jgi:hypothetical protein
MVVAVSAKAGRAAGLDVLEHGALPDLTTCVTIDPGKTKFAAQRSAADQGPNVYHTAP